MQKKMQKNGENGQQMWMRSKNANFLNEEMQQKNRRKKLWHNFKHWEKMKNGGGKHENIWVIPSQK